MSESNFKQIDNASMQILQSLIEAKSSLLNYYDDQANVDEVIQKAKDIDNSVDYYRETFTKLFQSIIDEGDTKNKNDESDKDNNDVIIVEGQVTDKGILLKDS